MNKHGRNSFWILLSLVALGLVVTAIEAPQIAEAERPTFLALKLLLLLVNVPVAFVFRENPYSTPGHVALGLSMILYSAHGQWYRPLYEYTFFQAMIAYTLLFFPPRRIFLCLLVLGLVVFSAVYGYRFDEVVLGSNTSLVEGMGGILVFALILIWLFKVFAEGRAFKEQALARFGLLGKHGATLLHDLKSAMMAPRVYTELIQEALERGDLEKARVLTQESLHSFDSMQSVVLGLNKMTQLTQLDTETIRLGQPLEEVRQILRGRLREIAVEIDGDQSIRANRSFISSILLNLFMNSIETFESRRTVKPAIRISIRKDSLVFEDNGGGFASEVLDKLKRGVPASSKLHGSGLGLYLLYDGIRDMGGKVELRNSSQGARVEIHFKGSERPTL